MGVRANTRRLAHLTAVLTRHGAGGLVGPRLRRWPWLARRLPPEPGRPERVKNVFAGLGGTFLKFGQMLSLQPDIVSLDVCNALFNLLDRVTPFGMDQVERTFTEELGATTGELFESFEPRPLATASIGQVHAAVLRGRKVAVKVQRPGVEAEFGGDISLMTGLIGLIRRLGLKPLEWMVEPLSEFVAWTREELDYRREAHFMERLRGNARANPVERVPAVVPELTTRRTLVMEFLEGVTVLDYLRALERGDRRLVRRLAAEGFEPNQFARHVIDNFLGDAFRHGLFHADLHPANLMILPGNVVGYIDFGITGALGLYSRRHLIAMTLAYTRGDLDGMCAAFFRVSAVGPDSDPDGFRAGLRRLAEDWYGPGGRGRKRLRKNFTLVMLDMLRLSRATGVWPERDVIKYIRSAIASDGLITRFAPGFDVGAYLERVCDRHLGRQSWAALLSHDALLGWAEANGRLMYDGVLRGAALLRQRAARPRDEGAPAAPRAGGGARRGGAPWLAVVACGVGVLIAFGPAGRPGAEVVVAAVLVAAAALLLARPGRRLGEV